MISQTAEYGLRAIVFLADQNGVSQTTSQIAEGTMVPAGYLAKVMQSLSKARVVHAQRGPNGGFVLAKPSDVLTVLDVVNAVDPIRRFPECPLKLPHHGKNLCPLHRKLDETAALAEQAFGRTTIHELLSVPQSRKPLCRFPLAPREF